MSEVEFLGESFQLEDEPNQFALMEFAGAAQDADDASLDSLAAIFRLVEAAITAEDWPRFRALARKKKATVEQLLPVAVGVFEAASERPTLRPVDSSAGPQPAAVNSADGSSNRVIERLEAEGRPSWALIALQEKEARTA